MKKWIYLWSSVLLLLVILISISVGSVTISLTETIESLWTLIQNKEAATSSQQIIMNIRTPRVLSAALIGVALSLSGVAMQGMLKNPLADGATLGVSAGGSLGAVLAIISGFTLPFIPFSGTMTTAIIGALLAMVFVLWSTYQVDCTMSNSSLILMGIILSMFINSVISLLLVLFRERVEQIVFWTMGSLAGKTYQDVFFLAIVVFIFGSLILFHAEEINAFTLGGDHARNLGVSVKRVRLILLISVSALIGTSVAISGTIGFVGLVVPHISRLLVGPNHKKLFPMTIIFGAIFLMLTDLVARTAFSPMELPIGVITSFIGAIIFIFIFRKQKRGI